MSLTFACLGLTAQTDSTAQAVEIAPPTDSLPAVAADSLPPAAAFTQDSLPSFGIASLDQDSLPAPPSKQQRYLDSLKAVSELQAIVTYQAEDSIVFDVTTNMMYLYSSSNLTYEDFNLQAQLVEVDITTQTIWAGPKKDSLEAAKDTTLRRPLFTQAGDTYSAEQLTYNFGSQKGRIIGGKMQEGDAYILASVAKYHPDGSFHGQNGKYTTCDADHPHFYIQSRRLKVLENQQMISGPLNLVIADFPIPIVVPFGFLPKIESQERKKGIVMPQYGSAQDRGFFLRGMGYYLPIGDFLDLKVDADIYTRGGWRLGGATRYNIKYKFSGSFGLEYGVQTFNERTDPDYRRTNAWRVNWSHNQPIDPTARISASVNISSSSSFQRNISYQENDFFQNNLNSSVNFSKSFNNLPFTVNVSARHTQDLNRGTMTLNLPEMNFTMNRQSPFRNVQGKNFNFLRQIGITYNVQVSNSIPTISDSLLWQVLFNPRDSVLLPEITGGDTIFVNRVGSSFFRNGAVHRSTAGTTIKLFQHINITPSFRYNEYWYTRTIARNFNQETRRVETMDVPGFARAYDFDGGVSATTNFYGLYQLIRSKREVTVRQRFSPTLGYNLRPDFSQETYGFYEKVQTDTLGNTRLFSVFSDGVYGGPSSGEQQSLNFGLSTILEMKYRKKASFLDDFDEKEDPYNRINLVDNIGVTSSYNFAADSFQLALFNVVARTNLFNNRLSVVGSSSFDPYDYGINEVSSPFRPSASRRQPVFLYNRTGQLARFTRANISMRTSFKSEKRNGQKSTEEPTDGLGRKAFFDQPLFQGFVLHSDQYVDFDVPWTIDLNYTFNYNRTDPLESAQISQILNVSGSLGITPNWQIRGGSGFDVQKLEVTNTNLNVYRLLHCWEMSFQWVPFGPLKSYGVTINVRNPTLQQLKVAKRNNWQDRF